MESWRKRFRFDPVPALLASGDVPLVYFARRDLLGDQTDPVDSLWQLREAERIVGKQLDDGAFKYPGGGKKHLRAAEDYNQLETFRMLRILVARYGFDNRHPAIKKAASYLFSRQTGEGDFRGITGTEYAPHYSAWIMELLIKAGYASDPRIKRGFDWFLAMRQDDGGWAWPIRTAGISYSDAIKDPNPVQPDRTKPFSHVLTGGVLRSFAAHPHYRKAEEARAAARLLKSRFFMPDKYADRRAAQYWAKFQYPFWWPNVLTALDSLSRMGFPTEDEDVQKGLDWFIAHQEESCSWKTSYKETNSAKSQSARLWICLAVCRVFKRFVSSD